jgi:hypothetical protein
MSSVGFMGILVHRCISKVDGMTQPYIKVKVLCRFVDIQIVIEGSSCKDLVSWESEVPR